MNIDPDIKRLLDSEEAGRERRANHLRLAIAALFLVIFAGFYLKAEQHYTAGYVILANFAALLSYSLLLEWLLRRGWRHPLITYLSFGSDLTCVSITVACSQFLDSGPGVSSAIVTIAAFFLFLALTGTRFSPRLCIFMGAFASLQFFVINELAKRAGDQGLATAQTMLIVVLLAATGLVQAAGVRRSQRLVVRIGLAERERQYIEDEAEMTKRLAITDELTGLYNRRYFYDQFEHHLTRAQRQSAPLGVLVADLDGFKDINDNLGHAAGDEVLRQTASVLRRVTRSSDVVARLGGDEMGILLVEADASRAKALAERLCDAVRNHPFQTAANAPALKLTLSIGLACFPSDGSDLKDLLATADRALYAAKNSGKDRVEYAASGCAVFNSMRGD